MKESPVIAVVGATGLIGNELVAVLDQVKIPNSGVRLFATEGSAGEVYKVGSDECVVETLTEDSFQGIDLAFFALPEEIAARYIPLALKAGAIVIDTSRFSRMDQNVPLVVPEVNWSLVPKDTKWLANPSSSAIELAPVLKVIHQMAGLKRVVVSSYQACSGAGKAALDELWEQTRAVFNQTAMPHEAFQHQIAFNTIPQIDVMQADGVTREERAFIEDLRRVLCLSSLPISMTAVRVSVFHSDAFSVNVETERAIEVAALVSLFEKQPGFSAYPDPSEFPLQVDVANTDEIHVARVRRDESVPHGVNLWVVVDNIRKGAALNAVQTAKTLLERSKA